MKRVFLPRPLKGCLWAALALLLAVSYYIALGCPTFTTRQELRRAEKAHMVGRSEIVDQLSATQYMEFEKLLVSETEDGIIFFGKYGTARSGRNFSGDWKYRFHYIEKTGAVTFAAPPNIFGFHGMHELPVYIFTEHENAVRAHISISVTGSRTYNGSNDNEMDWPFDVSFTGEANRDKNGFFRFHLTAPANQTSDPFGERNDKSFALFCISNLCSNHAYYDNQETLIIPIQVTLYDADGNVILTQELQLGPYALPEPTTEE